MTNFGAKIINNAISGLNAQQAQIANASNNIANVNTPGYSRRIVTLENRSGASFDGKISIGDGVNVASVLRIADSFLESALRTSTGEKAAADTQSAYLSRIEQLFNISGQNNSIGSTLTKFFTSFNDLSANPASIELRTNVVEAAQDLTTAINSTFNGLANLQKEADSRVSAEVTGINAITTKIAALNDRIKSREAANGIESAADERDQRELLLNQLAERISFDRLDMDDGSVTLSLSGGFPLVSGNTARQLEVTQNPSFAGATTAPSLFGGSLSYVVFDYDSSASNSHLDLSNAIRQGQGSLGALLDLRGVASPSDNNAFAAQGTIPELAKRIEALSRTLLTSFNTVYLGPDRDGSTAGHQPSSGDLDGNTPATFGLFDFSYSGSKDSDADGLPEESDLDAALASGQVKNFSSILKVAFSDPRKVAAARDVGSGAPAAPIFSPGDNANARAIAALQTTSISFGSYSTANMTVNDYYNQIVGFVGNLKASADLSKNVSSQSLIVAQNRRDEISAVSLDEEYSALTVYQQSYQASARMIKIADQMFQEVLGLI